jgi:hypothetical protein
LDRAMAVPGAFVGENPEKPGLSGRILGQLLTLGGSRSDPWVRP